VGQATAVLICFSYDSFIEFADRLQRAKKADVAEHPGVFCHVGLLVNGPAAWRLGALALRELPFA